MAYPEKFKDWIRKLDRAGVPAKEIVIQAQKEHPKFNQSNISRWRNPLKSADLTLQQMEENLQAMSAIKNPTNITLAKMDKLSKTIERQRRIVKQEKKSAKEARKERQRKTIASESDYLKEREKILHPDFGLYGYQKNVIVSDAAYKLLLKARQTGFTYSISADVLCRAAAGYDQMIFSASVDQALIWRDYMEEHASRLGYVLGKSKRKFKVNDKGMVHIVASVARTAQSRSGDITFDEAAWILHFDKLFPAVAPSIGIGTKSGDLKRIIVLSTPFAQPSYFHSLWVDHKRWHFFERHLVTIQDAVADGLDFDIDFMRAFFDAEEWAMAYECQFADDEASYFPMSLIQSCVDPEFNYYTPESSAHLRMGYDVARVRDLSVRAALDPKPDERFALAMMDAIQKASFDTQRTFIRSDLRSYPNANMKIDSTGIGMNLSEDMAREFPGRVQGIMFTQSSKKYMATNVRKLFEDKRYILPNDQAVISDVHSIKRKAGAKDVIFDSDRNEYGHADRFWALALAAYDINALGSSRGGGTKLRVGCR